MNNEIREDLYKEKYNEYVNNFIKNIVMDNPIILKEYPILEVEYNVDGTKKDIYSLASERDIKKMQIKSDENELDYKFSQNKISKKEYDENVKKLKKKEEEQDLLYDDLIFEIAEVFKVFGDTTRMKIISALLQDELCVGEIAEITNSTQSAISHQLRVLKQAKLVKFKKVGKTVYYSLDDDHIYQIYKLVKEHIEE